MALIRCGVLLALALVGWVGWRPLFRAAEKNFWALNALGVQPGYALAREAIGAGARWDEGD